ncbi:Bax inhibitor 1 [Dendrobium catenatum]|uniref:Bax inhibitor 1 n=1 Tax=Dendrobium catenatum TaxID=906689 RepID=A0A2I0VMN7_9ASPA|nr:Bax inhibitor 1 [Dendrobium catenatum]
MEAFFEGKTGSWGYDSLKNFRQISTSVQKHLRLVSTSPVYLTLCSALVASAAGVYLHILFNIGGILTMLGCFAGITFVMNTPPSENRKRLGYLMATAVLEGASIGPLFELILDFDPR